MTSYFKQISDAIKGEKDSVARERVPEHLQKMHINEIMERHPYHPYHPDVTKQGDSHPCYKQNEEFYTCMHAFEGKFMEGKKDDQGNPVPFPLHMRHVSCYWPQKIDLMKCLSSQKRKEMAAKKAAEEAEAGGQKKE